MSVFAAALAAFVALHVGISATGLRRGIVARLGEGRYRIVFALASAGLLYTMIAGFGALRADPFDPLNQALWTPPEWLRWPGAALVTFGVTLAVAGVLTPGPTYAGFEKASLARAEPARGVLRITRHPFLWGVALWAVAHLLVNGERFAPILFGALGAMALLGARSIDRKGAARDPEAWARFAAATSNIPFAAIVEGRNRLALGEIGWRLLAAVAALGLMVVLHERFTGFAAY